MRKYVMVGLLLVSAGCMAAKEYSWDHPVAIKGYTKQNGTMVEPYYRARPDTQNNGFNINSGSRNNEGWASTQNNNGNRGFENNY